MKKEQQMTTSSHAIIEPQVEKSSRGKSHGLIMEKEMTRCGRVSEEPQVEKSSRGRSGMLRMDTEVLSRGLTRNSRGAGRATFMNGEIAKHSSAGSSPLMIGAQVLTGGVTKSSRNGGNPMQMSSGMFLAGGVSKSSRGGGMQEIFEEFGAASGRTPLQRASGPINGIYDDVWMSPFPLSVIHEFQVTRAQNKHDHAIVKGMISEMALSRYQYMVTSGTVITLYFASQGQTQLLFSGFLEKMDVYEVGEQKEVTMELSGLTRTLDYAKKTLDYQAEDKKRNEIINDRMASYNNIAYDTLCEDAVIPEFLLQYEETDYEFLKRILSLVGAPIYTRMDGNEGRLVLGRPRKGNAVEIKCADYEAIYEKCLCYRIRCDRYLDLGTAVKAYGKTLWVKEANYSLQSGVSKNEYLLCEEKGLAVEEMTNPRVTGISLDGTIQDRQRDKVKIQLNATPQALTQRWFGYSSAAASSDGSGWYCMPEVGEEIRLYCPTDRENEAYVISAIRSGGAGESGGGGASGGSGGDSASAKEPANKSLSNAQGQEVNFTEEGVSLSCAGGIASINLKSSGEIEISAFGDIELLGEENVNMRAEDGITIMATDKISLTNDTGSSFTLDADITLNANRIKNNC